VTHHGDTEDTGKERMAYVITAPCLAIFAADEVPSQYQQDIPINAQYFQR